MTEQKEYQKSISGEEIAISVRNLSKEFKVYNKQKDGVSTSSSYSRGLGSLLGKSKYEKINVLKDVSFDILKGEMVGILGRNGAGKSTLLKIIAGILEPTSGKIKINGKMTSLLGFQAGLNQKLTARENIIQYGLVLGLSRREVLERVDDVLEFAELENFADVQISHFSTGMNARLAFSSSMLVNPDILLLDEILAVGDYFFYQKSVEVFQNIRKNKGTIILVSHSLPSIKQYCDRAMLLHNGVIEMMGEPDSVIKGYIALGLDNNPEDTPIPPSEDSLLFAAPANIYPDDSPFVAGMPDLTIKRLRWRGKALIEDNGFAFKDKSVLDIQCHNGEFVYAAIAAGAKYAEGIEKENEMVVAAKENLQKHGVLADKYRIEHGNMLGMLRKIKPETFDTIICAGVIKALVNKSGLMELIVKMKPSHIIIDANLDGSSQVASQTGIGHNSVVNPLENIDSTKGRNNIGLPSKATLELVLNTYKLKFKYIDFTKSGMTNWAGLEDYLVERRVSIIATL